MDQVMVSFWHHINKDLFTGKQRSLGRPEETFFRDRLHKDAELGAYLPSH